MSQAIADPEQLLRFAAQLQNFQSTVADALSALHGQFASLGETWRDQERQKFEAEYEELEQSVRRFLEATGGHVPYLRSKAEHLHAYQGQ